MANYNLILAGLNVYPSFRQICEASNYAEEITTSYISKIDPTAIITIDDGDLVVYSDSFSRDLFNKAESIFETAFQEKIGKLQGNLA